MEGQEPATHLQTGEASTTERVPDAAPRGAARLLVRRTTPIRRGGRNVGRNMRGRAMCGYPRTIWRARGSLVNGSL